MFFLLTTVRFRTIILWCEIVPFLFIQIYLCIFERNLHMSREKIDRIYESVKKINHAYEVWAVAHGLTLYEMQLYYEMLKSGEDTVTQRDLCQKMDAPKTSINSIIKKQLSTGYIKMQTNPQNKREKIISLTPSGQDFAKALIEPLLQYEEEAAAMLSDEEMDAAIAAQSQFAEILLQKVQKD